MSQSALRSPPAKVAHVLDAVIRVSPGAKRMDMVRHTRGVCNSIRFPFNNTLMQQSLPGTCS